MQMRRTASEDAEIAGVPIKKGDKVVVYFASGNRDERKYSDPEAFRPTRKEATHIGFGNGAHFCLGAHLARLEAKIFFESLLERVGDIRLAGHGERLPSYIFHGHTRLPMIWN
jgi:cytochrome P450